LLLKKFLNLFLSSIPDYTFYTILPVIKMYVPDAEFSSITLTNAIKVTKNTSVDLLGIKILQLIKNKFTFYNLDPQGVEAFIMGRPWLSV
jgi:hypothetical protein